MDRMIIRLWLYTKNVISLGRSLGADHWSNDSSLLATVDGR